MKMKLANDLGYGAIKATVDGERVKIPSVIVKQRHQDIQNAIDFDKLTNADEFMDQFYNHLDMTVQSPTVKEPSRMLFGNTAINSHLPLTSFDVNDMGGKSSTDLAMILTLGLIAGKALKNYYDKNHKLPTKTINVNVKMATALPIIEGRNADIISAYRKRFIDSSHLVTIHTFTKLVNVNITFDAIQVALEGEVAQYAIRKAGKDLKASIKADFDAWNPAYTTVSADEIISQKDLLGIDIGEGTTDYVVFTNGEVNPTGSSSLNKGYGSALESAVDDLQLQGMSVESRAGLQQIVNDPLTPFNRVRKEKVDQVIADQLDTLSSDIITHMSKVLRANSNSISLIYVYGGGATPLADTLREPLFEKTTQFTGGSGIPVIFIDKKYSQILNQLGLDLILSLM